MIDDDNKSFVERENYITIQGFMIKDLNLKGNELIIYAIIYGFSQLENQYFNGTLKYLAEWTNCTKRGVINILQSLESKDLIGKKEIVDRGVKKVHWWCKNFTGVVKKVHRGGEKSSPIDKLEDNIEDNIEKEKINNNIISLKEKSQNKRFSKPKVDEIKAYCDERGNDIDAQAFYDFYESKGWKVGTTPMKDWKACVRTWEHKDGFKPKKATKEAEITNSVDLSLVDLLKMIDEK